MSIIALIPSPLSEVTASEYTPTGPVYDYAIGGLPFLSAISNETPFIAETAPYRKEQFDSARDVGEQSLVYWWLKSQSSFHGGSGQKFLDTALNDDPLQPIRFDSSLGIDVWTPGQVTLLKSAPVNLVKTGAAQQLMTALDGTTPVYFLSSDATLTRATSGASAAVTWGGAGTILSLTNDGSRYYAADATAIYRGTLAGGAGALLWNTGSAAVTIAWVKQRLVAGIGPSLYELTTGGPALPAAKYTHPNPNWVWTSIVEGPDAIYAAGYAGGVSSVVRLSLGSDGVVPTLTSATTVAEMPPNETIRSMFSYLGAFLGIGTSKGLRVAIFDNGGGLTYGPRLFDTTNPILAMTGEDRFLFVGVTNELDGMSGLYRVDLGMETGFGQYAYATDLQARDTGNLTGVGLLGDRLVFSVAGKGAFLESTSELETSGTLTTSRIRYSTVEPKLLKLLRLRAAPLEGTISVSYTDPADVTDLIAEYTEQGVSTLEEVAVDSNPVEYASLVFTLERAVDTVSGPELRSYQLKALPAAKRQRLMQVPLLCFNNERDRTGQRLGNIGSARSRLTALQLMEANGDAVTFQQFSAGANETTERVVIDQLRFIQREGPTNEDAYGGILLVTLRSLE